MLVPMQPGMRPFVGMHLAIFFVINLLVSAGIGALAVAQGHGLGGVALRVFATLIILQAAYAAWLLAVAWFSPPDVGDEAPDRAQSDARPVPRPVPGRGARDSIH